MAEKVLEDVQIQLTEDLTLPVIKQLLDDLKKEKVLNKEEVESIMESNAVRADKARDLIRSVNNKGRVASEIMIAKLQVHDKYLCKKLGLQPHDTREVPHKLSLQPSYEEPAPGAPAHEPITVSDHDSDKEYKMDSIPRGFCVIINNMNFENEDEERIGSDKDAAALMKVFGSLYFEVKTYTNLKAKAMKALLLEFSKKKHGDCFVCCVLSHGEKNGVIGTDQKLCPMKDILSPFDGKNCPSLAGKPKVFFIQACRGKNKEEKVVVSADNAAKADDFILTSDGPEEITIPRNADFLIAMSTVEDFVSYRNKDGSWFIQELCTQLGKGSQCGEDILTILIKVNDEVSKLEGVEKVKQKKENFLWGWFAIEHETTREAKMIPEPRFTLRKKLIFRVPKKSSEPAVI
ncbi:hypothetical protein AOLI_G00219090 [Acnodon oligacanthus]